MVKPRARNASDDGSGTPEVKLSSEYSSLGQAPALTSTKVNGSLEMIPKNPVPGLELKIGVLLLNATSRTRLVKPVKFTRS